jgi:hypothetical protein
MQGGIILFEAGDFLFEMLRGRAAYALIPAVCAVLIALAMCWLTKRIHQREYLDRDRPDYAAIARMEREVWDEAFEHEGAPAPAPRVISGRTAPAAPNRKCARCKTPLTATHYRSTVTGERTCTACRDR